MRLIWVLLFAIVFIGGGCSSSQKAQESMETLNGVVQKGPFVGGEVQVYEVKTNTLLGKARIDANGTYKIEVPKKEGYYLQAKGKFLNEITGKTSAQEATLHAIVLSGQSNVNLNLLTTFEAKRVQELLRKKSLIEAKKSALEDIKSHFHLSKEPSKLNMLQADDKDNQALLLFSASLLASAKDKNISLYMKELTQDFSKDGTFDENATLLKEIKDHVENNMSDLAQNIEEVLGIDKNKLHKPKWTETLTGINIIDAKLSALLFGNTKLQVSNEKTLPLGITSTSVKFIFLIHYRPNQNDNFRANVKLQTPQGNFILPVTIGIKNANADGTYNIELAVDIDKNIKRIFELVSPNAIAFKIEMGGDSIIVKNLPQFVTLNNKIAQDVTINSLNITGTCANRSLEEFAKVTINGHINNTQVDFNDVCIRYDAKNFPHKLELVSGEGTVKGKVNFTHSSLNSLIIDIDKIDSNGFYLKKLTLLLPKEHSIHNKLHQYINPYGKEVVELNINQYVSSLNDINETFNLGNDYYLHLPNMPLYFKFNKIAFENGKIVFKDTIPQYLFSYQNQDAPNNANRFYAPNGDPINLFLVNNKVSSSSAIHFNGVNNITFIYPRVKVNSGSFVVDINNSKMEISQVNNDNFLHLSYISNCLGSKCSKTVETKDLNLTNFDETNLFNDGASVLVYLKSLGTISWGSNGNGATFVRNNDRGAIVYITGFILPTNNEDEVISYLLGNAKIDNNSLNYYKWESNEVKKGRYLFAGVNVGRLIIDDLSQNSQGISLAGKKGVIHFRSGEDLEITSNKASKYFIRNSGVTGVFNRDQTPIDTRIYGYRAYFTRFAWRQIANEIDEYTWIDGKFHIPKRGNFDIAFDSLRIKCDGSVEGAHVIPCENNGVNCGVSLASWKAKTKFTYLKFEGDAICSAQREMHIGHIIDMKALQHTLALDVTWKPIGIPKKSKITGSAINRFDGDLSKRDSDDYGGYDLLMHSVKLSSNGSQGWVELNSTIGLPVWDAMKASMRVQNRLLSRPAPTLVVDEGDLYDFDLFKSNQELLDSIIKDYNATAHYKWGGILDFTLPIYYDGNEKFFKGRELKHIDLAFWKINSRIDFIKPKSTSIKYGFSADISYFKKIKFNIDLNDPNSLKEIDKVLVDQMKWFSRNNKGEGPFEATFGQIHKKLNFTNSLLSTTLDITLEELAYEGLKELSNSLGKNDPFTFVSDITAKIHTAPMLAKQEVNKIVYETIINELNKGFDKLDMAFNNATGNMTYAEFAKANDAALKEVLFYLRQVHEGVKEYEKLFTLVKDVNNTINEANKIITKANELYNEVVGYVKPLDSNKKCSFTYTINHGVFKPAGDVLKTVDDVNKAIQSIPMSQIKFIAVKIKKYTGVNVNSLIATVHKIKKVAKMLNDTVNDNKGLIQSNFNKYICQSQAIENTLKTITNQFKKIDQLRKELNIILADINKALRDKGIVGKYVYGVDKLCKSLEQNILALYHNQNNMVQDALTLIVKNILKIKEIKALFVNNPNEIEGNDGIDIIRLAVINKVESLLEQALMPLNNKIFDPAGKIIDDLIPTFSADELRRYVVTKFFEIEPIKKLNESFEKHLKPITDEVNNVVSAVTGGLNNAVHFALSKASDAINKKLQEIHNNFVGKFLNDVPLNSFGIDGYALFGRNYLQKVHVDGDFSLIGSKKDTTFSFKAALDMWRNNVESSGGCVSKDFNGTYNVQISSRDIDMPLGKIKLKVDLILAGLTLMPTGLPVGVYGAISSKSGFKMNKFALYNVGFALGVGKFETYLGAKAKGKVDTILFGVDTLVGKVCNKDIQENFIPETIYDFIQLPNNQFFGAMVFGEAQIPVWQQGCMLTVVARAKAGSWLLFGDPTPKLGAVIGGAAFGQGVCIATLGGEVLLMAEIGLNLSIDSIRFQGNGWGAAGLGLCDESWDSVEDSRDDDWCGTGDAQFSARYDKSIQLLKVDFSAVH